MHLSYAVLVSAVLVASASAAAIQPRQNNACVVKKVNKSPKKVRCGVFGHLKKPAVVIDSFTDSSALSCAEQCLNYSNCKSFGVDADGVCSLYGKSLRKMRFVKDNPSSSASGSATFSGRKCYTCEPCTGSLDDSFYLRSKRSPIEGAWFQYDDTTKAVTLNNEPDGLRRLFAIEPCTNALVHKTTRRVAFASYHGEDPHKTLINFEQRQDNDDFVQPLSCAIKDDPAGFQRLSCTDEHYSSFAYDPDGNYVFAADGQMISDDSLQSTELEVVPAFPDQEDQEVYRVKATSPGTSRPDQWLEIQANGGPVGFDDSEVSAHDFAVEDETGYLYSYDGYMATVCDYGSSSTDIDRVLPWYHEYIRPFRQNRNITCSPVVCTQRPQPGQVIECSAGRYDAAGFSSAAPGYLAMGIDGSSGFTTMTLTRGSEG